MSNCTPSSCNKSYCNSFGSLVFFLNVFILIKYYINIILLIFNIMISTNKLKKLFLTIFKWKILLRSAVTSIDYYLWVIYSYYPGVIHARFLQPQPRATAKTTITAETSMITNQIYFVRWELLIHSNLIWKEQNIKSEIFLN